MSDENAPISEKIVTGSEDEAAAAKLWAVYISEAEKYDKALVESWKSDMEGIIIFAGLFSASLTPFLLESYTTLLAASANGSTYHIPSATPFTPPVTSLLCNALWLISLGLSLTCALIATLLEQWARNFLHKADLRSAPVIRARVFSYLYYGLRRFGMHRVVDVIPLLLHASLLFFFAGLVAFLIPVNTALTVIAAILLFIVAAVYSVLTFLPLWYLDCPYRTPLSGLFWAVVQTVKRIWHVSRVGNTSHTSRGDTMVQAMSRSAAKGSVARTARDYQALVWTMKSLTEDDKFEPFAEAIPDILWSPTRRREAYANHVQRLVYNPDAQLLARIHILFDSCNTGLLSVETAKRRRIICFKALWALSTLSKPLRSISSPVSNSPVHFGGYSTFKELGTYEEDSDIAHYSASARAMMGWSTFCAESFRMSSISRSGDLPYLIIFQYLSQSAALASLPYRYKDTVAIISLERPIPFSIYRSNLEFYLDGVTTRRMATMNATAEKEERHWIDDIITLFFSFWRPESTLPIPSGIIRYLTRRSSDYAVRRVLRKSGIEIYLWSCFPTSLFGGPSVSPPMILATPVDLLTALWRLLSLSSDHPRFTYEPTLEAVAAEETSYIHVSVVALIRTRVLKGLPISRTTTVGNAITAFGHRVFPQETMVQLPAELFTQTIEDSMSNSLFDTTLSAIHNRIIEGNIQVLSQFLEHCGSDNVLPYKTVETLEKIGDIHPKIAVRHSHQTRFAEAIQMVFAPERLTHRLVMNSIINCGLWDAYVNPDIGLVPWLENIAARKKIQDAFTDYENKLISSSPANSDSAAVLTRLQKILERLESWRPYINV
ncbi:hypothetical protein DFH07DRAFT_1058240 [Mycena maculata]|uniref:DUF6535 domain-containing protein n=1 Tax=Mycena maculata TaxID=230809 RepID=A0AAD7JPS5_9AGAR|nr:hypothetical protein DFH07DRAFT_1058240 [Mycena maculata]